MTFARLLMAVAGLAVAAVIGWAWLGEGAPLLSEGAAILALPWGVVTLADLYAGFLFAAVVIFIAEPDKRVALVWAAPIFFLGNVVTAA